jgi:hypothetical protein
MKKRLLVLLYSLVTFSTVVLPLGATDPQTLTFGKSYDADSCDELVEVLPPPVFQWVRKAFVPSIGLHGCLRAQHPLDHAIHRIDEILLCVPVPDPKLRHIVELRHHIRLMGRIPAAGNDMAEHVQ